MHRGQAGAFAALVQTAVFVTAAPVCTTSDFSPGVQQERGQDFVYEIATEGQKWHLGAELWDPAHN